MDNIINTQYIYTLIFIVRKCEIYNYVFMSNPLTFTSTNLGCFTVLILVNMIMTKFESDSFTCLISFLYFIYLDLWPYTIDCLTHNSWKPGCAFSFNMGWRILVFYSKHILASMNHNYNTNTVVYFDGKDGNLYLRLRTMSHTIYAAKFEQTITHQHVLLRRESQSYWWSIRNNNIVVARFNCTSHIY